MTGYQQEASDSGRMKVKRIYNEYAKVVYVAMCFCLLYAGYYVALSFITTLFPGGRGFTILSLIYGTNCITSFGVPWFQLQVSRLACACNSDKLCMILGAALKSLFILSILSESFELVIAGAVLAGFGASLLWVPQGVYLQNLVHHSTSSEHYGKKFGTFFFCFYLSGVFGQIAAIALLAGSIPLRFVVVAASCLCILAFVMFCFCSKSIVQCKKHDEKSLDKISSVSGIHSTEIEIKISNDKSEDLGCDQKAVATEKSQGFLVLWTKFFQNSQNCLFTPYLLLHGITAAFTFGLFPSIISDVNRQQNFGNATADLNKTISSMFLVYSIATAMGSLIWGYLYDRVQQMRVCPILITHSILIILITTLSTLCIYLIGNTTAQFWVVAALCGFMETLCNSVINFELSKNVSTSDTSVAFAWYRICLCVSFVCMSTMSGYVFKTPSVNGFTPITAGMMTLLAYGGVAIGCALYRKFKMTQILVK